MNAKCPHCGQEYNVDESTAGQEAQCSACSNVFTIAAPVAPAPAPTPSSEPQFKTFKIRTSPAAGAASSSGAGYAASAAAQRPAPQASIPNYLWQSIVVTLLCCIPFGIASIIFATQVNSKLASGDVDGALKSSKSAKMWAWIAFGVGLVVQIIMVSIQVAAMFTAPSLIGTI